MRYKPRKAVSLKNAPTAIVAVTNYTVPMTVDTAALIASKLRVIILVRARQFLAPLPFQQPRFRIIGNACGNRGVDFLVAHNFSHKKALCAPRALPRQGADRWTRYASHSVASRLPRIPAGKPGVGWITLRLLR